MDGNKELPIGQAADVSLREDAAENDQVVISSTEDKSAHMMDCFPTLTSAYAAYIRARQVYVVDGNKQALYSAQKLVIETMHNVTEFIDIGAALMLNDSVIEVQFEVLGRLGVI